MAQDRRPAGGPNRPSLTRSEQRPASVPGQGSERQPAGKPEKQLAVPDAAAKDAASFELLRVWVAEQSQQISLRAGVWQEPAAWGVMLADLARNIVQVHVEHDEDLDGEAFLAGLLEGFDNEIETVLDEFGEGE